MTNGIATALQKYEQERSSKKAVLLTPCSGYYLYDNRFCTITEFELTLICPNLQIQSTSVPCALFFGLVDDTPLRSVKEAGEFSPEWLSLIFHIRLENENELLRGILFAQDRSACFSLFTDGDTEKLYRAVIASAHSPPLATSPGRELAAYAADCVRNDIHRLTALYLHGRKLCQLRKEVQKT